MLADRCDELCNVMLPAVLSNIKYMRLMFHLFF